MSKVSVPGRISRQIGSTALPGRLCVGNRVCVSAVTSEFVSRLAYVGMTYAKPRLRVHLIIVRILPSHHVGN